MKLSVLAVLAVCLCSASAFMPHKLVKKYAMKKVAESCFGKEVLSDVKQEMSAACDQCRAQDSPDLPNLRERVQAFVGEREKRSLSGRFNVAKLQKMRLKISAMVGNITCVMRELKMLDSANQVDLPAIKDRINALKVKEELKKDLLEGADLCSQFASCLPDGLVEKSPVMASIGRQMAFFKCFKKSKVASCMKQDFREEYLPKLLEMDSDVDEEESFETIIASYSMEDAGDM